MIFTPSWESGIERPSARGYYPNHQGILISDDLRTMIEPRTMNETIGCKHAASLSSWLAGGMRESSSLVAASDEMKMAPTPISARMLCEVPKVCFPLTHRSYISIMSKIG